MRQQLPSLKALRAFEAVVRHRSASKAADELHVSPGAVSHQIRTLEQELGVPLFERSAGRLSPTVEALEIAAQIREGFDQIFGAVRRLRLTNDPAFLTISVEVTFDMLWLGPRIPSFQAKYPEIEVRLDLVDDDPEFHRRGVDLAILPGYGFFSGCEAIKLTDEAISPVCAPHYLDGIGTPALLSPVDLLAAPLLHVEWFEPEASFRKLAWERWFNEAGVKTIGGTLCGAHFSHTTIALQLAIAGHGVALASDCLVADAIASGSLVRPFDIPLKIPSDYYLVCANADKDRANVVAFRDWLVAEMASKRPVVAVQ
jgi:LysR family glycine cleavage system transcriptional activator